MAGPAYQPFGAGIDGKLQISELVQTIAGSNPKAAFAVFKKGGHEVIDQSPVFFESGSLPFL